MILATRSHAADPAETSDDLRAVIDIDMSMEGAARWEAQAPRNLAWEVGHLSPLVPGTS